MDEVSTRSTHPRSMPRHLETNPDTQLVTSRLLHYHEARFLQVKAKRWKKIFQIFFCLKHFYDQTLVPLFVFFFFMQQLLLPADNRISQVVGIIGLGDSFRSNRPNQKWTDNPTYHFISVDIDKYTLFTHCWTSM